MAATRTTRMTDKSLALSIALGALLFISFKAGSAQTPSPSPQIDGAQLFADNCAVCHGDEGQGRVGATLAKDWPSIRPDLTVKTIIETGVPGSKMPAWSQANGGPFSPAEIEALVSYILSWQTGGTHAVTPAATVTLIPPITPIPNVVGDPNRGHQLFVENCQMCHGENGQGRSGAALAHIWSGIRPDLNLRATIARGISGSLMPAWSQANGGPLDDAQIDDLVAFILTLQTTNPVIQVSPAAPSFLLPVVSPLAGWLGVVLFLVLTAAILVVALLLQRKHS